MATVNQYKFVRPDQIPVGSEVVSDSEIMDFWRDHFERLIDKAVNRLKIATDEKLIEQLSVEVVDLIRKSFSVTRTVLVMTEIEIHF